MTLRFTLLFLLMGFPLLGEEELVFYSSAPLVLKKSQLRDLYLGRLFEIRKNSVRPVVRSEGKAHEIFLKDFIFKNLSQFKRHWKKMLFTGKATPPPSVEGEIQGFSLLRKKRDDRTVWLFYSLKSEDPEGLYRVQVDP